MTVANRQRSIKVRDFNSNFMWREKRNWAVTVSLILNSFTKKSLEPTTDILNFYSCFSHRDLFHRSENESLCKLFEVNFVLNEKFTFKAERMIRRGWKTHSEFNRKWTPVDIKNYLTKDTLITFSLFKSRK